MWEQYAGKSWIENKDNFPKDLPVGVSLQLQQLDLISLFTRLHLGKSAW